MDINAPSHAYNELETIAEAAFRAHSVTLFSQLPAGVRDDLLKKQEEVFARHGVTRDDFFTDAEFIAVD